MRAIGTLCVIAISVSLASRWRTSRPYRIPARSDPTLIHRGISRVRIAGGRSTYLCSTRPIGRRSPWQAPEA
jgi:hypothetical protein